MGGSAPGGRARSARQLYRRARRRLLLPAPRCGRWRTISLRAPAPPPSAPARPAPGARSSPSCTSTTHKRRQGTAQPSPANPGGGFFCWRPRASIYMGRGDHASAEKTLGSCFVVQGAISVLLTAALFTFQFRKAMRQLEESGAGAK